MNNRLLKAEPIAFAVFVLALLTPIWSFHYFLTGDGPCHVYNARVLLDLWSGRNTAFFDPYYFENRGFNPNWFSHFMLAILQMALPGVIAEKVLLSGYVILFTTGVRYLLKQINPNSTFLSLPASLLTMHYLLQSGFYNYAFSIALFFWVCGYWLHFRNRFTVQSLLIQAFLWIVLYFMHPVGFVFTLAFVASSVLGEIPAAARNSGVQGVYRLLKERALHLLLSLLPVFLRFSEYIYANSWSQGANQDNPHDAIKSLYSLTALITLTTQERATTSITAAFLFGTAITALVLRLRKPRRQGMDFLLLFFALALFNYIYQTGKHSIELMMPIRLQLFPWLGLLLWTATASFPARAKVAIGAISALLLGLFLFFRWPVYRANSEQVGKNLQCLPFIKDNSVVLVLNYDFNGPKRPNGEHFGNKSMNFMHVADYIGYTKTVIMSDNYEALRTYFPLEWHWQRDLYGQTKKEEINFENRPPRADFKDYTRRTGGTINYVLILGLDDQSPDRNHPYTQEIFQQLDQGYQSVFQNSDQTVRLYEIKS